jgi:hypothetical protein
VPTMPTASSGRPTSFACRSRVGIAGWKAAKRLPIARPGLRASPTTTAATTASCSAPTNRSATPRALSKSKPTAHPTSRLPTRPKTAKPASHPVRRGVENVAPACGLQPEHSTRQCFRLAEVNQVHGEERSGLGRLGPCDDRPQLAEILLGAPSATETEPEQETQSDDDCQRPVNPPGGLGVVRLWRGWK